MSSINESMNILIHFKRKFFFQSGISCDAKDIEDSGGTIDIDIEVLTKDYTAEYTFDKRKEISVNKDLPTVIFIHGFTGVSDLVELLKDGNFAPIRIKFILISFEKKRSFFFFSLFQAWTKSSTS